MEKFPTQKPQQTVSPEKAVKNDESELNTNNQETFEKSEHGIPLVLNKEGQKVESDQYKQLNDIAPEQALEIYRALKNLESGEFKDSKLRDENGELRIVWHGSPRKFDEFKTDAKGEWRDMNYGVHFSSSKEMVEQYSEKAYSALDNIRYNLAEEVSEIKDGSKLNSEHFANGDKIYNEIIADLVEKGEESQFYKKAYKFDPKKKEYSDERRVHLDAITYGKQRFGVDWAFEIFNGEMPNKENAYFDERANLWLGRDVGKYAYACVLNIETPFEQETTDVDHDFEVGENAHTEKQTDGTILYHSEPVRAMGGMVAEEVKGTYSVAVFDPSQIKIIGVESTDGKKGPKTFRVSENFKQNLPEEQVIDNGLGLFIRHKNLYHGSGITGIQRMNPAEETTVGEGIYFTSAPSDALGYAERRSRKNKDGVPTVYSAQIENLKFLDLRNRTNITKILGGFKTLLLAEKNKDLPWYTERSIDDAIELISSEKWLNLKQIGFAHGKLFSEYVKSLGYDGLITIEEGEGEDIGKHDTYLLFDADKIKELGS